MTTQMANPQTRNHGFLVNVRPGRAEIAMMLLVLMKKWMKAYRDLKHHAAVAEASLAAPSPQPRGKII